LTDPVLRPFDTSSADHRPMGLDPFQPGPRDDRVRGAGRPPRPRPTRPPEGRI